MISARWLSFYYENKGSSILQSASHSLHLKTLTVKRQTGRMPNNASLTINNGNYIIINIDLPVIYFMNVMKVAVFSKILFTSRSKLYDWIWKVCVV